MLSRALLRQAGVGRTLLRTNPLRAFSEAVSVVRDEQAEVESLEAKNARLGVDTKYDPTKHSCLLTFPWNFPETIQKYKSTHAATLGAWDPWIQNSRAVVDFNNLFREFHQYVALPDPKGIRKICERRLADEVNQAIRRISLECLSLEMANLTVTQPSIRTLKFELHHGLSVDRDSNGQASDYSISKSSFMGAPCTYYTPKEDRRELLDNLDDLKPYVVAVTCVIESPMKLYVQNQNYSKILFGSDDRELVTNVVRFESNIAWYDMLKVLPVNNKPTLKWRITDFNDLMKSNAYF